MIHYHGTPITPRSALVPMVGRHFCVPYPNPGDLATCLQIGASVMLDNGAFSAWTRGITVDWNEYYKWATPHVRHPHWAVIPDVIDGGEEDNDALLLDCPLPRECAAPVWHLHESIYRLIRLCGAYPKVCFGSSGEYRDPGTSAWNTRVNEAWNAIEASGHRPWVHMLRAMKEASNGHWPFASADSTNIARNHAGSSVRPAQEPELMANRIDARNPRYVGKRSLQRSFL